MSEVHGMNVGLAVVVMDNSASQELEIIINLVGIPAQAADLVVKSQVSGFFISSLQGWKL